MIPIRNVHHGWRLWCAQQACLPFTLFLCGALVSLNGQVPGQYTITTVAGVGSAGMSGDGGQGTAAELRNPVTLAEDSLGNRYIADTFNGRIRKLAADGTITTVAGSDIFGYAGDAGPATSAGLNNPCGVAIDSAGNVYIADTANHMIRKVAPGGIITRVAGTGAADFTGDAGPATDATLNRPIAIALDSAGNLYIADTMNNRIRKLATDGTISTIAGNGVAGFSGDGNAAIEASLYHPQGLALDAGGNLFVADTFNDRVRKISPDGTIVTVAGNGIARYSGDGGPARVASLNYPKGIAVDASGNLFIADSFNSRIRMVTEDGRISTIAGNGTHGEGGDGGRATNAMFRFPSGVAIGPFASLYVADTDNHRIRLISPFADVTRSPEIIRAGTPAAFGGVPSTTPGSWIEIFGSNFAATSRQWAGSDFVGLQAPRSLGGITVTIGGERAFISYVSPNQVNALVPSNVGSGQQPLTVTSASGSSETYVITVNPTQPGLLSPPSFRIAERQYAAATFSDGTYAVPSLAVSGVASRPARPNETIVLYGIGLGPVTPHIDAGEVVQTANRLSLPIEVQIGGVRAQVTNAGLAPGSVGLYQINVVVPNLPSDDATSLTFTVGGVRGEQTLFIAVRN